MSLPGPVRAGLLEKWFMKCSRERSRSPKQPNVVFILADNVANVKEILDAGEPDDRKAVVRSFLAGSESTAPLNERCCAGISYRRLHRLSWWRWEELNLRHGAYETPALPLSYTAVVREVAELRRRILPQGWPTCPKTIAHSRT